MRTGVELLLALVCPVLCALGVTSYAVVTSDRSTTRVEVGKAAYVALPISLVLWCVAVVVFHGAFDAPDLARANPTSASARLTAGFAIYAVVLAIVLRVRLSRPLEPEP